MLGSFSIHPTLALVGIILLAFVLRVAQLDFQPLWSDEGYSLLFATRDLATMLNRTALDIHPPLYYALLHLWIQFAGKSDIAVRYFSVAMGVATIPFVYVLARRLLNRPIALIAAFLVAIAPVQVYYSQEVRMYGLVTLLSIVSVYLFLRLLVAPTRALWLAYVLITAAALYTQYYAAFILAFQVIIALIQATRARLSLSAFRFPFYAWLSIALLYLPWVIYAGMKLYTYVIFKVSHEAYPTQDPISFLAQHLAAFSIGHVTSWTWLTWSSFAFVLCAAFGFVAMSTRPRDHLTTRPTLLLSLYLLVPITLGYVVSLIYPFHPIRYERLLLLASPAFYILIAAGVAALNRRVIALTAGAALACFSALSLYDFYTVPRYPDEDYRPLIAQIQTLAQPGDNLLAIYPWQVGYLESYYRGAPLSIFETPNDDWGRNPSQMQRDLDALLAAHPRVWIPALQTLGRIVEDSLDRNLRPRAFSVLDAWYGTTRLELFAAARDPQPSVRPLPFDNTFVLLNWGISTDAVVPGQDLVRVWLAWGADPPSQPKLSLRLADSKGNVWAQDDRGVELGVQRIGLPIPAGTPPGSYALSLILYGDNLTSTPVSLGPVEISPNRDPNIGTVPRPLLVDFANGMQLVGYDAATKPLKPGETSGVTLFWGATRRQNLDYAASIQLHDILNNTYLDAKGAIALGIYSPTSWLVNELVRDPRTFNLGGDVPDGTYNLTVSLIDPAAQARVKTNDGRDSVRLMTVQVKGRQHYFGAPSPSNQVNVRFGDLARLVGYDAIRSGNNLRVVLYWQALGSSQISYKGFVHILGSKGQLLTQRDQVPSAGDFPTTTWVKNEYLVDPYDIALTTNPADFQIQIGLYDPATNARLPVFDTSGNPIGDSILLSRQF